MRVRLCQVISISLSILLFLSSVSTTKDSSGESPSFGPSITDKNLKVEPVITGLDRPVSITFLGPSDMLVVERNTGIVLRVIDGHLIKEPLLDVNVFTAIESGMLGIETAKNKDGKMYVFLYYTEAELQDGNDPKKNIGNRLYRYELINNKLVNPKLLLALPKGSGSHNGGAIKLGPDGNLYIPVGDLSQYDITGVSNGTQAQNIQNGSRPDLSGGILRITQDGRPVGGIIGDSFPESLYFAYGIKNSFGIDFDPITGIMWDTENGPSFGDEINIVRPGFNSGWIQVQGVWQPNFAEGWIKGELFDKSDNLVDFEGKGKYSSPEFTWQDPVGPTAIKFLTNTKLGSQYKNDIFVGDIKYGRIYDFELNKNRTGLELSGELSDKVSNTQEELTPVTFGKGFAGISDLEVGPDGYLYVVSYANVCTGSTGQELSEGTVYKISPKTALTNVSNNTSVPSNTSYNSRIIGNITTSNAALNLSGLTKGNNDTIIPVENETYWSAPLPVNATYIEGSFRIIEHENEKSKDNHAGLVWQEGNNKTYYAFVRPGPKLITLADSEKEISCASLTAGNVDSNKITIINSPERIYVYHNDLLRINVPREFIGTNISPVGIRTYNTEAGFDYLKIGQFPQNLSQFLLPEANLTINENNSISIKAMKGYFD